MKRQHTTIALAISMLFSGSYAVAATDIVGQRVDNGRVDFYRVPKPTEVQPIVAYPMPSGVTRDEAIAMRDRAAQTPHSPANVTKSLEEAKGLSLFVSGKADLTPAAKTSIAALAKEINAKGTIVGGRIAVIGHTDDQRLSPNAKRLFKDNQGLSEARALSVTAYLKQLLNNPAIVYSIEGDGESRPIASNKTPEGMARNRRVELNVWFDIAAPFVAAPGPALPGCSPQAVAQVDRARSASRLMASRSIGRFPNEADGQRCADVALERADIQVRYDSLADRAADECLGHTRRRRQR
jgi:outer membrane protein OmpA-like peptidoglycan-associated protein